MFIRKILFIFFVGIDKINRRNIGFINSRKSGGLFCLSHDANLANEAYDMLCVDLKKHGVGILKITINSFDGHYHFIGDIRRSLDSQEFNCDLILDLTGDIDFILSNMSKKRRSNIKASLRKEYRVRVINNKHSFDIKKLYDEFVANKSGKKINIDYLKKILNSNITTTLAVINDSGVMLGFVIFIIDKVRNEAFYFMSSINRNERCEYVVERIVYQFIVNNLNKINKLNFMESTPSYKSGVYKFKSQWGVKSFPNITVKRYLGFYELLRYFLSCFKRLMK